MCVHERLGLGSISIGKFMPTYNEVIVISPLLCFVIWEYFSVIYKHNKRLEIKWCIAVISSVQLSIFKPLVMTIEFAVSTLFLSESTKQVKE